MSIQVKDFIHIPGENDAEYIRLLNEQIERQKKLLNKAMAKLEKTEPKTGEWIYAKEQLEIVPMWECSCCKIRMPKKFNYCPNCGTRMLREDGIEE